MSEFVGLVESEQSELASLVKASDVRDLDQTLRQALFSAVERLAMVDPQWSTYAHRQRACASGQSHEKCKQHCSCLKCYSLKASQQHQSLVTDYFRLFREFGDHKCLYLSVKSPLDSPDELFDVIRTSSIAWQKFTSRKSKKRNSFDRNVAGWCRSFVATISPYDGDWSYYVHAMLLLRPECMQADASAWDHLWKRRTRRVNDSVENCRLLPWPTSRAIPPEVLSAVQTMSRNGIDPTQLCRERRGIVMCDTDLMKTVHEALRDRNLIYKQWPKTPDQDA